MQGEKERKSNIELLRLFALYGVLILHYMHNGGGCGFAIEHAIANGIDTPFFKILRALFMQSANLFFIIAGYCSCRSKKITFRKPLLLILTLIFSKLVRYAVNIALGYVPFSVSGLIFELTPADYFIILYCVLYVFTPYINRFLESLSDQELLKLVAMSFLIFSVWAFVIDALAAPDDSAWWRFLNPIGPIATQHGYTILNFTLVYVLGAFAAREYFFKRWKRYIWLIIYLTSSACTYLLSDLIVSIDIVYAYNSPFVVLNTFALLMFFTGLDVKSRFINALAKPVFFVYTFHWGTFSLLFIERVMQTGSHLLMVAHGLLVPIAVYIICIPAYFLYSLIIPRLVTGRAARLKRTSG